MNKRYLIDNSFKYELKRSLEYHNNSCDYLYSKLQICLVNLNDNY